MDAAVSHGQKTVITSTTEWEDSYRPLPFLFFGLLMIWTILVGAWTLNTWSKRRWQVCVCFTAAGEASLPLHHPFQPPPLVVTFFFQTHLLSYLQQTSNLQWILTAVPVLKALVLGLSFVFW